MTLPKRRFTRMALAILFCAGGLNGLVPRISWGQIPQDHRNSGSNPLPLPTSSGEAPPPPSNPLITADQAAIDAAMLKLTAAQQNFNQTVDQLRTAFMQIQSWQDASAALDQAQKDLSAAQQAVLADLPNTNPDYVAAKTARDNAHAAVDAANKSGDDTPDVLGPLAANALTADAAVDSLEKEAFAGDPACQAASGRLVTCQEARAKLLQEFKDTLPANPDFDAAQKALDDATKEHAAALAKLAADEATPSTAPPNSGAEK